jgi:hypothetical protein
VKKRSSGHGVRVPQQGGRDSTPQNQAVPISGLARVYRNKKAVQIQLSIQAARDLGFLDRDQLAYTSDQSGQVTFWRVEGLPIGAEALLDQAWEADLQRIANGALFMQCWNEALHRCKRSPGTFREVFTLLLQEKGLSLPTGRGYSDVHRQKSEQAQERREAKLPQLSEPPIEPQPTATDRKPERKRKPPRAPTVTLLPPTQPPRS